MGLVEAVTEDEIASGGVVVPGCRGCDVCRGCDICRGCVIVLAAAAALFVGVGSGDLGVVGASMKAVTGARSILALHRLQNRVFATTITARQTQ